MNVTTKKELTDRQQEVLDYITEEIENGVPPTVREIMNAFEFTSPNGVMCHLRALEKKGWIVRGQNSSRSIRLTDPPELKSSRELFVACREVAFASTPSELEQARQLCLQAISNADTLS